MRVAAYRGTTVYRHEVLHERDLGHSWWDTMRSKEVSEELEISQLMH